MTRRFFPIWLLTTWLTAVAASSQTTKAVLLVDRLGVQVDKSFGCVSGFSPSVDNAALINASMSNESQLHAIFFPGKVWELNKPIIVTNTSRVLAGMGIGRPGSGNTWGINRGPTSRIVWGPNSVTFNGTSVTATGTSGSLVITVSGYTCTDTDVLLTLDIDGGTGSWTPGLYTILSRSGQTWTLDRSPISSGSGSAMTGYLKGTILRDDGFGNGYTGLYFQGNRETAATTDQRAAIGWQQRPYVPPITFDGSTVSGSATGATNVVVITGHVVTNEYVGQALTITNSPPGAGNWIAGAHTITGLSGTDNSYTLATNCSTATTTTGMTGSLPPRTPNTGKAVLRDCTFDNLDVGILLGRGLNQLGGMATSYAGHGDSNADHFESDHLMFGQCDYAMCVRANQAINFDNNNWHTQKVNTIVYLERGGRGVWRGVRTTANEGFGGPHLCRIGAQGLDGTAVHSPIVFEEFVIDDPDDDVTLLDMDGTGNMIGQVVFRDGFISEAPGAGGKPSGPIVTVKDGFNCTLENVQPIYNAAIRLDKSGGNGTSSWIPSATIIGCTFAEADPDTPEDVLFDNGTLDDGCEVIFIGNTTRGFSRRACKSGVYHIDSGGGGHWVQEWPSP